MNVDWPQRLIGEGAQESVAFTRYGIAAKFAWLLQAEDAEGRSDNRLRITPP